MSAAVKKKRKKKLKVSPCAALGAAAAVLLAVFLIFHRWEGRPEAERGSKVPPGSWRYGIDISHNNAGKIVWDSLFVMTDSKRRTIRDPYLAKEIKPVSFVFIKATEGASFKDKDFKENWKAAGKTDLRRGAYHFFRSSKDGEIQARNFISTVGDLRFKDLPPVLDIETIHIGCPKELLNQRALQWLKAVEKRYGKKPIIYASSSFIKDYLKSEIVGNYPIWVAHYEKDSPSFEGWTWWQFTDRAVVKGVPGEVDLSVMKED
jgi:lysozyme